MISLFDYIIESLINAKELEKDLKFIESSKKEVYDILDTDDYKHGKVLGMDSDDLKGKSNQHLFLENDATYYKIQYENNIIGIVSIVFPEQMKNINNNNFIKDNCQDIFSLFIYNSISQKHKNVDVFDLKETDFEDESMYHNDASYTRVQLRELAQCLLEHTAYIGVWAINQNIKKKLDINDFSLIKIFFDKLIQLCKSHKAQYIWAHGKDDHITKMYVKVGKFINPYEELFKINIDKGYFGDNEKIKNYFTQLTKTLVIKKISDTQNLKLKFSNNKTTLTKDTNDIQDVLNAPKKIVELIKDAMIWGFIYYEGEQYGISEENVLKIWNDEDLVLVKKVIDAFKKKGYDFEYKTDDEWKSKRKNFKDPLAD